MLINEITLLFFCQVEWHDYRYAILPLITESEKRWGARGISEDHEADFVHDFFFFLEKLFMKF